ncbi:MAG: glycosyltransferase [Actinobacteria bacterium]|nr:glycosyltransferase [Actinomycetota bacterium]
MKIFSDMHHESLYHSLYLLFEKRLGWELYRPIGLEWFKEGYWAINNQEDTARQFLEIGNEPKDGTIPLNDGHEKGDVYYIQDHHNHSWQKAITLETFKNTKFDVLLASIPQHIKPFQELIDKYQPQAKLIFQMGNHFDITGLPIKNLMASTAPFSFEGNKVFYHQEFDLGTFKPSGNPPEKMITSFINVLDKNGGMVNYYTLENIMPDYQFFSYGGQCRDGSVVGIENMARIMQNSAFGFHVKSGGDGFGHVIHNFMACGRPVIVNYSEYKNQLAGKLLIPDETCIVAEIGDDMSKVAEKIKSLTPLQYEWMCQRALDKFLEEVDYDKEERHIRKFLGDLT